MRTELFDFDLPDNRIALHPVSPRDSARMLCVEPGAGPLLSDRGVRDLVDILRPGDCIVVNDTRVIPSALEGHRMARADAPSVGAGADATVSVHVNLHKRVDAQRWLAFARPGKRLKEGDVVSFGSPDTIEFSASVEAKRDGGEIALRFDKAGAELDAAIAAAGSMPLPPYIAAKRSAGTDDARDYQTVYAAREGAVAAPTAGLHFTPELFDALDTRGVSRQTVTLHVGAGTFLPVKVDDTREHVMHAEWGEVSAETADALNGTRQAGGRIVAVGTTSLRLLESAVNDAGCFAAFCDDTAIFITPGYKFRAVDILMTNFHLPRSTLFMLVSAFSGLDTMKSAYAHAIEAGYRFYSYGDACLLFRDDNGASGV